VFTENDGKTHPISSKMVQVAMRIVELSTVLLTAGCFLIANSGLAQEDIPSPTGAPEKDSKGPVTVGSEENVDEGKASKTIQRDKIAGTGIIFTAPAVDFGYLSTSPNSANIFSKLEAPASGWLVEPKLGFGVFSEKIALDLLAGVQISNLSGRRLGTVVNLANESPDADYTKLTPEQPYTDQKTSTIVEGDGRIRFSGGVYQAGLAASAIFSSAQKIYSSVPDVGAPYIVMVGPQFVYEQRFSGNIFRVSSSAQFSATGNQRSAFNFKFGASYSFLLNSPYLKVTEKKVVKSKTTIQKSIVTTREQNIIQNENVTFIFDSQTINFKFNKSELSEKSNAFVSGLGQIFAAQRSDWQQLTVEGHTDSKGNPEYNKRLSQARAETVKRVLIDNGLSSSDVVAIGYGKERLLISPERNEIDFAKNRRVEIKVKGLRDSRILQRSITRLQSEIFPSTQGPQNQEGQGQGDQQ
jgi:outer membrane protein OmpA-like peptidoglycan-associated protein